MTDPGEQIEKVAKEILIAARAALSDQHYVTVPEYQAVLPILARFYREAQVEALDELRAGFEEEAEHCYQTACTYGHDDAGDPRGHLMREGNQAKRVAQRIAQLLARLRSEGEPK